ncbi:DsrE family protein [Maridesulfovibrio zosterae]|uniref:DsrE family protein n=1 Tax=Maridesulfovibrio zosterae TaxID=82171 RepID=UPI000415A935|nr:DsrE family protein [Maridesulfovibrio zosterae]
MYCLYAFNGELMCFVHVLLNGLDMAEKGMKVSIVFEGASVALIPELEKKDCPFHKLYMKAKSQGLFDGACKACSVKLQVKEDVEKSGIPLIGEMSGHPAMSDYIEKGYKIITF